MITNLTTETTPEETTPAFDDATTKVIVMQSGFEQHTRGSSEVNFSEAASLGKQFEHLPPIHKLHSEFVQQFCVAVPLHV